MKEMIKSRILMEMSSYINNEELRELKMCLERNLYDVKIEQSSTDIVKYEFETNETMLKRFAFEKRLEGMSVKTLEQYVRETKRFFNLIGKHYSETNSDDVMYYLSILSSKMSINSVDNCRKFLKAFYKWLYENEYVKKDIFIKIKPIKRINIKNEFLTSEEVTMVRDSCKNDIRGLAIIDFLLSTGLRVSECSNLKISDVDFSTNSVNVYATKTNDHRIVYIDSNASKHLKDYLFTRTDNSPYLFVNKRVVKGNIRKMDNCSIQDVVKKYCHIARIDKKCTVHIFRKTLATRLFARGMDAATIAKILGHKSFSTTVKFYLTIHDSDVKYFYNKYI